MPTYAYKCDQGHSYTEVRPMSEDQKQTTCPEDGCGLSLKRVFENAAVQFKGSGWAGRAR